MDEVEALDHRLRALLPTTFGDSTSFHRIFKAQAFRDLVTHPDVVALSYHQRRRLLTLLTRDEPKVRPLRLSDFLPDGCFLALESLYNEHFELDELTASGPPYSKQLFPIAYAAFADAWNLFGDHAKTLDRPNFAFDRTWMGHYRLFSLTPEQIARRLARIDCPNEGDPRLLANIAARVDLDGRLVEQT